MKYINRITIACLLLSLPFSFIIAAPGGSLVIIGGGLQPDNADIYNTFIRLGGGKENIRIAIIPAASFSPAKSGNGYKKDFMDYGVAGERIKVFPVAVKDDKSTEDVDESKWSGNGSDEKLAKEMLGYTAVFFVGGDQERYIQTLKTKEGKDTALLASIRKVYERGGVLGGSSAGAAIMSDPMICGGNPLAALLNGSVFRKEACPGKEGKNKVRLMQGLGFFPHGLAGQHFLKRGRMGRMIAALIDLKPFSMGVGVDEDTAAVYHSKSGTLEVAGRSGILMIDTRKAKAKRTEAGLEGVSVVLHYLEAGDRYHFETGAFTINPKRKPIEAGKEYYKTSPLKTDIFAADAVKKAITGGLVDNKAGQAEGMAFTLQKDGQDNTVHRGRGVHLVFKKTVHTKGFWGKIEGKETYSAIHVNLDIVPVNVQVKRNMYQK
jgi:cyanophycinase